MSRIVAVGTAVPPHIFRQSDVKSYVEHTFSDSVEHIDRYLSIFENTAIQQRRMSQPLEWFQEDHTFAQRNQIYIEMACKLGEEAILRCLAQSGYQTREIDHLIFVSTTGLATPSIDAHLVHRLNMNPHIKRTPIWGLGCAGGVVGLTRALEFARACPDEKILLVAVELCGLTFRKNDRSKSNIVATSLFADGAAAVLVTGSEVPIRVPQDTFLHYHSSQSRVFPDSLDVMGWDLEDDGLKVVFSKEIPTLVKKEVGPVLQSFLQNQGLTHKDIQRWMAHPGGKKVLQAYEEITGLPAESFASASEILRDFGNMSSVTVLFVLQHELQNQHLAQEKGILMAMGPGFSAEFLLVEWLPIQQESQLIKPDHIPYANPRYQRQLPDWEVELT
ncbi:type III polyketide synthase [Thermoactinomyces sp. DSM 45892]|uniref:type III polyketide synthase n=1 Tax=Thermoactinomyces sp. DSM 45892 TaxID=1882753 RepID=UPI000895C80F|nr:3-oxoacyl-[acyl-carrier-protein] synthase III C-terminal domain-containing protein [Thermoactinomyces sp. DSM 45892]SDZ28452.1 15-methylpalmitoyl-4-hydroxy-2-pyrone synthase [Thermoactinomyces sp. DSM 45892]